MSEYELLHKEQGRERDKSEKQITHLNQIREKTKIWHANEEGRK
jgi:hypothetical protein